MELPRVKLTDDLEQAMHRYLTDHDPPSIASVVREALASFLAEQGYKVEDIHPPWGGPRTQSDEEE